LLNAVYNLKSVIFTIISGILIASNALYAQGTQERFGQNRVQHKRFIWSYFESKHFVTYFYQGGQEIGKYTVQYAEKVLPEIEALFDFKLSKRIEILVYNDLSDLNQTNIGYGTETFNIGGQIRFIKNKIFIHFNGNHRELERQIRQGIAQVFLSHMMFGTNFTEVLQNAVLMNLPTWFVTGLTAYVGNNWDAEKDDRLKDNILNGRFKKISRLRGEEATFYGHAFWHFVEEKYGKSSVTNLIYLSRSSRTLDNSFIFVMGANVKTILDEMYQFYYNRFANEKENKEIPDIKNMVPVKIKAGRHYSQLKMSDDSRKIAYVSNHMGAWRVHLRNLETGKRKVIKRGGIKTNTLVTSYQYPLLAWSPDQKTLAIIYERRDKLHLLLYDADKKRKKRQHAYITKFQQIHDFSFTDNPKMLVMSAVNRGYSDVYLYAIPSTTIQQITTDHFDDLHVSFFKSDTHRGILFSSNRTTDTLQTLTLDSTTHEKNFDIWFYDLNTQNKVLTRLTNTLHIAETQPQQYNEKYFSYLSDENGIKNRYLGYFKNILARYDTIVFFRDSIVTNPKYDLDSLRKAANIYPDSVKVISIYKDIGEVFPQTDLVSNILEEDISMKAEKTAQMFLIDAIPRFFIQSLPAEVDEHKPPLKKTEYELFRRKQLESELKKQKPKETIHRLIIGDETTEEISEEEDEPVLFFQSEFNTAPEINVPYRRSISYYEKDEEKQEPLFRLNKVIPYRVRFSTDYFNTQLDNSLIMTRYQKFTPGYPAFNNPDWASAMVTLGITDLMEDYHIMGGFRFPFNFRDSEYFLSYEAIKKRLDKKLMYYRRAERLVFDVNSEIPFYDISPQIKPIEAKQITNYGELRLNYPIDVIRSVRNYFAYRNEKYVFLATDQISLNIPVYSEHWLFYRLEYVFDNTMRLGLNILDGLRFKVFGEIHKDFQMKPRALTDNFNIKLPSFGNSYLSVIGLDVRHYLKLHKEIIWANRFAYGSSFGTRKLVYYLGGVDGWMGAQFDNSIEVNQNNNYAFQTVVTNMRGFKQNIRNGNNFAVINSEIRIPIFSYLIHKPIRSEFIKNFQIIAFTDIGTAWEGINPYDPNNPVFQETIGSPPVTVKVNYYRNPFVSGYGFGLRSVLLGYFARLDIAWGNDSGRIGRPIAYFSLSIDF
jgi:Tol biopolymer transport system component